MKKLYFLSLVLLAFFNISKAQDIIADHPVFDYSGPSNAVLSAHLTVVNQSSQTLDLVVASYNHNLTAGHFTYFCWFVCYDTSVTTSPDSIRLAPGTSTNAFVDYVVPNNIPGHDELSYRFYDQNGVSTDTLTVTFNYDFMPVGIYEVTSGRNFSITGPNPANEFTKITYVVNSKADAKVVVTNMIGEKINEIRLYDKQNTMTVPVKQLKSGIYIYSLVVDGKVMSSKKLVVAHQ